MKKYKRFSKKFIESILDSQKKELNPILFDNGKLKNNVSNQITDILYSWLEKNAPEVILDSMVLIGSSAGYRYNDTSDIDVNVQVSNITPLKIRELFKILPNGNYLEGTKHPINFYLVRNDQAVKQADNSYDILNKEWIKYPVRDDNVIPYSYILSIAEFFMSGIDNRINEFEKDKKELDYYNQLLKVEQNVNKDDIEERISIKKEELKSDIDALKIAHHVIRGFREEAFDKDFDTTYSINIENKKGNLSVNNIVYKMLEQFGYLDKLIKYENIQI